MRRSPMARLYVDKPRPFPQYPDISYADNGASHDYQGVTIEAERRMSKGLFVQLAYTAARDTGNTQEWTTRIENPFDLNADTGRDSATPSTPHDERGDVQELPFGRGRKWLTSAPRLVDLALGGWELSGVGFVQSGLFLTPTISMPDPTGTRFTTAAARPTVTLRPDQLRDSALADPVRCGLVRRIGICRRSRRAVRIAERGSIVGPGLNLWHLGINKRFTLSDHAGAPSLRVELTSTNAFNWPQYGNPNVNVTPTNVSAGRISSIGGTGGGHPAGRHAQHEARRPRGVVSQ